MARKLSPSNCVNLRLCNHKQKEPNLAYDLNSLTNEKRMRAPRIVLLGEQKIGKSSFAAGAEFPAFLPIKGEEGIDDLKPQPFAPPEPCGSLADVMGWLYSFGRDEHPYQTVVIDSVSTLEPIIHAEICQEAGVGSINEGPLGFGTGLDKAGVVWRQITEVLDALRTHRNMTSILVGHVAVRRFDDPNGESYDQYQWDIHHKAANLLYRWADCILFCNTKVVVTHEKLGFHKENVRNVGREIAPGSRFLYTQKRPSHPGGGRGAYGHLPYELPLNWGNFRDAVAAEAAKVQ